MSAPEFERIITFAPAFDKRNADQSKNYGIHGVELRFVLRGPLGATQFLLYTNWHLAHVQAELDSRTHPKFPHLSCHPMPADRGYHWSAPRYEDQRAMACDLLPGGRCYYDGSGLNAEDTYRALLERGHDGVWSDLEAYYRQLASEQP